MVLLLFLLAAAMPQQTEAAVKLNKTAVSINVKKIVTLKVSGTNGKVTWKSSNNKIATVSSLGVVKGVNKGTATITATVSKSTLRCKVTVKQPVHTHKWVNVTKTVHHAEKSHIEKCKVGTKTVVDKEAWDEDVYKLITTCSACGYQSENGLEVAEHTVDVHDGEASHSTEKVKVGIKHHAAVTHEEPVYKEVKVVDKKAWDETVVIGQKCSGCGATK